MSGNWRRSPKSRRMLFRLSPDDLALIADAAEARGMRPSEFAREAVRHFAGLAVHPGPEAMATLNAAADQLRGAATNVNQIARAFNRGWLATESDIYPDLEALAQALVRVRREILDLRRLPEAKPR